MGLKKMLVYTNIIQICIYILFFSLFSCNYPDIDSVPEFNLDITMYENLDKCNYENTNDCEIFQIINRL